MDYRLTQTGAEVQGILDRSPLDVTGAQLDTFITEASEGWYLVPLDSGGSMLVQVVMDGPVIYQVGLTEPHSGRIMLRHYNTQATNPAWTEWTDAYVDKLTAQDIAFGHVSDSGMKITIGGVDHIVSQTSQPLGSSNAFVAPTWEALTIALETKQDTISDLSTIRSGAAAGATAYQKPGTGIPASDMASSVQTDLGKAATAYQKPSGGIPSSDMASAVQTDLGKAATALQPSALNDYYNKTQVDTALGNKQNTLTFDNTPTANSTNPVTSAGIKTYVDNHSSSVTIDDELSTTSENPVQNKVVTVALNGKQATIADLSTIRSGAAAGATAYQKPSGGIPSIDMASAVQTSLGKADTAYQKPSGGIPSSDMASAVQTALAAADAAAPQATTYTKAEVNALLNPINAQIVWVASAEWPLATGTANTIYCVQGTTSFTAYGWTGSAFQELATYAWIVTNSVAQNISDPVSSGAVFESIKNGISYSNYSHSVFTSQTPNITPASSIALSQVGDFLEIKVKANDTNFILRRNFSYNQPRIMYTAKNNLQIRFTPSVNPFNYQDNSVDNTKAQIIRLELTSVSNGDYTYDVYLDGVKVGSTTQTSATYAPYWDQIGYQTTMDLYYIKGKSAGVPFEYIKFAEMSGAVGVTDSYVSDQLDGLYQINSHLSLIDDEISAIKPKINGDNLYFSFTKNSNVWAAESHFTIYQRIYGNVYIRTNLIKYVVTGTYTAPDGYWRIERTDIGTFVDGVFTQQFSQAITAGENEFVLQWAGGGDYNFSGGYSGGFHYGETIEDSGCFVEFYVDDKKLTDLSEDIPITSCKSFFYKELSTIYQHHDDTVAAWHYKKTEFRDGGYHTFNEIQLVQALDFFAYFGIVCVGREISTYAMPENANTLTDMGDGSTTIANQFSSHNHSIHYEGNGFCTDAESRIIVGNDAENTLVVYNSSSYNKFYRGTPTITGSTLNRGAGETTVKIYPCHLIS